ncbi:hypothetical protein QWY85_01580 [Neolewinella lacunae]|uniref:DUF4129 domain-containing protein n=1 Tax=Neolewinella lacunae TaxID=1517758 RepID=A0A923PHY0_9BACT|nr:hypothetical protein [Neolewinella lacunae]MBC6994397.1 hypothetical protein [Neolewinella lacunae]MDN3633328.1 hypothetical protein [Neolewinella lacunae]
MTLLIRFYRPLRARWPFPVAGRLATVALPLVMALAIFPALSAQNSPSPAFPTDRHRELMEDISFKPIEVDEAAEPAEDPFEWTDFNWKIDLSDNATLFIALLLLLALGLLIFRMLGDIELRKRTQDAAPDERIDINSIEEEQLVAAGVSLSLLERAENAGQFDLAVRLHYIQLLKELQDGKLIKYRRDFSNRDYQNQLRRSDFLADFRAVTADYERFWYGKYPIDRLSYRLVQRKFSVLNQRIQTATTKPADYA